METVLPKSLFPAVAGRAFLNIAAGGLPPTATVEAAQRWLQHLPGIDSHQFAAPTVVEKARTKLASLLQCSPDEIAFARNTTHAVNVALAALGLGAGGRLLIPQDEFFGLEAVAEGLRRRGVRIVRVPKGPHGDLDWEFFSHQVRIGASALLLSWVCFKSGRRFDVRRAAAMCHTAGIPVVVDAMQAVGFVPEPIASLGASFVAFGLNKGLLGPPGIGVLWVDASMLAHARPFSCGLGSFSDAQSDSAYADGARRYEYGGPNYFGLCVAQESMDLLLQLPGSAVAAHVAALSRTLMGELADQGIACALRVDEDVPSHIVSITDAGSHAHALALREVGVDVSAFPDRVRVSFGAYNDARDVSRFLTAYSRLRR